MKLLPVVTVLSAFLFMGCAHQIQINPKNDAFVEAETKIEKVVGYHLSDAQRQEKVTTPGGGGDKVTYTPYKDVESILYTVLLNKFEDVYLVKDLDDIGFIKQNEIKLVFIPEILIDSSSSSLVTWPLTKFIIALLSFF